MEMSVSLSLMQQTITLDSTFPKSVHDVAVFNNLRENSCKSLKICLTTGTLIVNYSVFAHGVPGGSVMKNLPAMQETWVSSLGSEGPLEKGKDTHSSILAWRIPMDCIVHGVTKSKDHSMKMI